uniref:Uncharacterized protein n=1 Tax=viral metagenome TaxID=1070528 RepID=A0A6C0B6Z9_9ZZZZ
MIDHDHAAVVWKYIALDKKVNPAPFMEHMSLYSNLFIQPVGHVLFWGCYFFFPVLFEYFGGKVDMSTFSILFYAASSLQVLWSAFSSWSEVIEHYHLGTTLYTWKILTHGLGLPLITINSADRNHQYFKYAAAISLLQNLS